MRKFKVILTQDNKSGPFNILYNINDDIYMANLSSSGLLAENITSSSLASGVDILIPFSANNILVKNKKETCDTFQQIVLSSVNVPDIPLITYPIYLPPSTPTPTLTPSPTPTPTSVFLSYEFRVTAANNLVTVCSDNQFPITIWGNNPSFVKNERFYTNSSLISKFNGNGYLYKLSGSPLFVGINLNGDVYTVDECGVIIPSTTPTPTPTLTPTPTPTPTPTSTPTPSYSTFTIYLNTSPYGGWDSSSEACNNTGQAKILYTRPASTLSEAINNGYAFYTTNTLNSIYNGNNKYFKITNSIGGQYIFIGSDGFVSNGIQNCS
jgi:hypothetical protein